MKNRHVSLILALGLSLTLLGCKSNSELLSRAKISKAQAQTTALSRFPSSSVKDCELEEEKGRLVWSIDLSIPGSKDIKEVWVDASSGEIVNVETETPAQQADEAEAKRKESKK